MEKVVLSEPLRTAIGTFGERLRMFPRSISELQW